MNSNNNNNSNTLPTSTDVSGWSIDQVASWASSKFSTQTVQKLRDQEVSGNSLLTLTYDKLTNPPFNIPGGPAQEIVDFATRLQSAPTHVPSGPSNPPGSEVEGHIILQKLILTGVPGCTLRENRFTTPQTKFAHNVANFQTVGRKTTLQQAYTGMGRRKDMSTNNGASHAAYNHLVATHSPPGGGKSTFLDKILEREATDLQNCNDLNLAAVLQNSVPLAVTYNSKTSYTAAGSFDNVAQYSLCSRLLFSYFFTASSSLVYFQSFLEQWKHLLEISIVIKCIRHDAEGRPILLGLDEVVAAFGKQNVDGKRVSEIISQVGKALNTFAWDEFNAVVTTLDTFVINTEKTHSGRPIEWVILSRLTTEQAMGLFHTTLQGDNRHVLRSLIIACGGHGRSLEQLKVCWDNNPKLSSSLDLNQFLPLLNGYLSGFNMLSLTTQLVVCALANSKIPLNSCPDTTSGKTLQEYIRDGYFINNLSGTEIAVVPIISPLALLYFAKGDYNDSFSKKLAALLYKMLLVNPGYWQEFEIFHAHWEAIARMVRSGGPVSVPYWYTEQDEGGPNASTINVKPKSEGVVTISQQAKASPEKLLATNVDYHRGVFLFDTSTNNPGFDIILFEDNVAVAIECRFSAPLSATKLKRNDIIAKYQKTTELLQPHHADLEITHEILVVVAYRELEEDIYPLPPNIFVVDKYMLRKLYSPTLLPIWEAIFLEFNDAPKLAALQGFD